MNLLTSDVFICIKDYVFEAKLYFFFKYLLTFLVGPDGKKGVRE